MTTLVEFLKVLAICVAILFLIAVAYAIIEVFVNNIAVKKSKKEFRDNLQKIFEESLQEIAKEELQEKKKKATKKTAKTTKKTTKDE